jgi:hypothetical protein
LPIVVVGLAQWFDATQLQRLLDEDRVTFQAAPFLYAITAAHILTPATIIAIALAGWWSRSAVIGAAYAVVGGLIAFSPALTAGFATGTNNTPPLAPEPIASLLSEIYFDTARGLTLAVPTIAGAMFLIGLALIAQRLRNRRGRAAIVVRPSSTADRPQSDGLNGAMETTRHAT